MISSSGRKGTVWFSARTRALATTNRTPSAIVRTLTRSLMMERARFISSSSTPVPIANTGWLMVAPKSPFSQVATIPNQMRNSPQKMLVRVPFCTDFSLGWLPVPLRLA